MIALNLAERGWLPDAVVRFGIRRLLKARLQQQKALAQENRAAIPSFYERLRSEPIAVQTQDANRQHYEMPAAMFRYILGHRMKYSCDLFPTGTESLDQAEDAMLALTCARARLEDGMTILELGCGWGSLSLWMAEHLNLNGADADAYAKQVIASDFEKPGDEDVFEKVWSDVQNKGLVLSEDEVREKMASLLEVAREQVTSE